MAHSLGKSDRPVAVVIPFYNEGRPLEDFSLRLQDAFAGSYVHFYFINDCSTDGYHPAQVAPELTKTVKQTVIVNSKNIGHGPSVVKGLRRAVAEGASFVLTVDGDGNFDEIDLARKIRSLPKTRWEVVLFDRTGRKQEWFRVFASWFSRLVVVIKAGSSPPDANTPFRLYTHQSATAVLSLLPDTARTPNLLASIVLRRLKVPVVHESVREVARGNTASGVTWGGGAKQLPSRKFIVFCAKSLLEIVKFQTPKK